MGLEFVRSRPVLTANSRLVACAASSSDWELQLDINILIFSLDPTRACGAYTCMRRSRRRGQLWPIGQISLISEHRQISYDRFADNLVPSTFCCSLTLLLLERSAFQARSKNTRFLLGCLMP